MVLTVKSYIGHIW